MFRTFRWALGLKLHDSWLVELSKQGLDAYKDGGTGAAYVAQLAALLLQAAPACGGGDMERGSAHSSLCEEALLWVTSRQELPPLVSAFHMHQRRAAVRAVGVHYVALAMQARNGHV